MRIWETAQQIFTLPDLRKKILYVIFLLVVARILAHIAIPIVSSIELREIIQRQTALFGSNQLLGLYNMFSGGGMSNFSIIMMGVGPYITSSIIFQLLTMIIPSLDQMNRESESGHQKINYYTRILTVPLAIIQGYAMIRLLQGQNILGTLDTFQWIVALFSITAGTILLMWLGELISENGIGNGVSIIISLGIIAGLPGQVGQTMALLDTGKIASLIVFAIVGILVVAGIVLANEGTRQIPVTYARRIRGLKSYGGVDTHLPIKVNSAGVIPIIFAMSMLIFPGVAARFFQNAKSEWLANAAHWLGNIFQNNWFYGVAYFLLVVFFTYFYTGVIFKPDQMAENLQKQGGFIPGIRPGRETAEYLSKIITRITLSGAIFLGLIAVLPFIMQAVTRVSTLAIGGTGVLIMVSVIIETMRQIQAQLAMRSYERY